MIVYPIILSVVDTRAYEEVGDRMVPVPGSGDSRDCDRCGRAHEVHATVQYEDGKLAVVGTGCMGRASAFGKKLAGRASTVARLEKKLFELRSKIVELEAANRTVDGLKMPEAVWGTRREHPIVEVGDGWAYADHARTPADREERVLCAKSSWRRNRLFEILGRHTSSMSDMERHLEDAEELRDRALKSLQKALSEES